MTQHSPCYSAVSSSLTNTPPDCSNYLPFCHTHYLIHRIDTMVSWARVAPLKITTSLLQRVTAESSRKLMSSEEYSSALRKLNNKQRKVVVFLPLLFKFSTPFCVFLFLYLYPLSTPILSSPFPPSLLFLLINSLSS